MNVVSLLQPWASLVAVGAKRWETRSWRPPQRTQTIAIHASKQLKKDDRQWWRSMEDLGLGWMHDKIGPVDQLPLGSIIAVATIGCFERTEHIAPDLSRDERLVGDYSKGRWAWELANVHQLPEPIPCAGSLGLWAVPPAISAEIGRYLESVVGVRS